MRLTPRALWLLLGLAASGCVGGPTSDWPKGADEDDGDSPLTPPTNGAADAGASAGGLDAGRPTFDDGDCAGPDG
ncbi:MAG: hypothetical protein ABW252_24730, partial [Polyangiales bacterium]